MKTPTEARETKARWRAKNKDKIKENARKYRAANRERLAEYNRSWDKAHPERARGRSRKWLANNPEKAGMWAKNNPEKNKENAIKWRKANPEKCRVARLKWKSKNIESIRRKRRIADGYPEPTRECPQLCECCGGPPNAKALHLDHCHSTGEFRGWVCGKCNTGIGMLGDTQFGLHQAIMYLGRADLQLLRGEYVW